MSDSIICPKCHYENIVLSCGFCLQCGTDLTPPAEGEEPTVAGESTASESTGGGSASRDPVRDMLVDTLDRTIRLVAEQSQFGLQASDTRWRVRVPLDDGRRQNVLVTLDETDQDGDEMLRFLSMCGPATEKNALALLKINGHAPYCAFAVRKVGEEQAFVVNATLPADSANRATIGKTLLSVARHADYVEKKIQSGSDKY